MSRKSSWTAGLVVLLGLVGGTQLASAAGPYIVLLGAPAAGKSTHAAKIGPKYDIPIISASEVLEKRIKRATSYSGTPAQKNAALKRAQKSRQALSRLKAGELVDDEMLNGIIASRISQDDCEDGFIIDGYPNSVEQASFLDGYLADHGITGLKVIYLDIPDEVSLARMKQRGRVDDRGPFGPERLRQFRANISHVLAYYEGTDFTTISTTKEPAVSASEIDAAIKK